MNPNDVAPALVGVIFFICVAAVVILRGPIGKALARRLEGGAGDPRAGERVRELDERIARLEELQGRLLEMEERMDFAERLLAGKRGAGLQEQKP